MLSAQTTIWATGMGEALERLRADHAEEGGFEGAPGVLSFRTHYGSIEAHYDAQSARIAVHAGDETNLSYMKMAVASHILEYVGAHARIEWSGDGRTGGLPPFFREATVQSVEAVSPHLRRVRLKGSNLARFAVNGLHLRILLPPSGRVPVWPTLGANGMVDWPGGEDALTVRIYTIRRIDPDAGWLDIDFVVHPGEHGAPGSEFALNVRPGAVVGLFGPGGGGVPEAPALLLVGDETALPAIARILETIPDGTSVDAILELGGEEDVIALPRRDSVRLRWLLRKGRPAGTAGLLPAALREIDPTTLPEDVYVWAGCEFSDFREIRGIVRKSWKLPKDRHLIVSYWRRGMAGEQRRPDD